MALDPLIGMAFEFRRPSGAVGHQARAWPNGIPIEHRLVDIAVIIIAGIPWCRVRTGIALNADSQGLGLSVAILEGRGDPWRPEKPGRPYPVP
jgi:hypothetical protein